jgi:hypothetical protein
VLSGLGFKQIGVSRCRRAVVALSSRCRRAVALHWRLATGNCDPAYYMTTEQQRVDGVHVRSVLARCRARERGAAVIGSDVAG